MTDTEMINNVAQNEGLKTHKFSESVKVGKAKEDEFELELKKRGLRYERSDAGARHQFDFKVVFPIENSSPVAIKVEIKTDNRAMDTHNLALEIKSSNRTSGWFIKPKADVFIIFVGETIYVMHKVDFRYILTRNIDKLDRLRVVLNKKYASIVLAVPLSELKRYKANDMDHVIRIIQGMIRNHHS